jgi:triosephosphate isomerase
MIRKPIALANWKMSMTAGQGLAFIDELESELGALPEQVDVVLCPPFTALRALSRRLGDSPIQLGGQNIAPSSELARTGEISGPLLADAGCSWVMLGHWEVRNHLGDDDEKVRRKAHLAIQAGLKPILFLGEPSESRAGQQRQLEARLESTLTGIEGDQVAQMALVYEPESAIGADSPSATDRVAAATGSIRSELRARWGNAVAERARIVYGGSVAPQYAADLLACPEVDGLGATRRGRDAAVFAEIVREIANAKVG